MERKIVKKSVVFSVMWDGVHYLHEDSLHDAVCYAKYLAEKYPLFSFSVQVEKIEVSSYRIS